MDWAIDEAGYRTISAWASLYLEFQFHLLIATDSWSKDSGVQSLCFLWQQLNINGLSKLIKVFLIQSYSKLLADKLDRLIHWLEWDYVVKQHDFSFEYFLNQCSVVKVDPFSLSNLTITVAIKNNRLATVLYADL